MNKELSGPELRKLVKELMLKKLNVIKEDDEEELGIYGSGFDSHEFDNDAMQAAMADIKAAGHEFEPLGTSKFEKNLDIDTMKKDLSTANLNLPKEKEKTKKIQQNLDKRYKHEKRFGAGSLNETGEWSGDEEDQAWIDSLKNELDLVKGEITPGIIMDINDVRGFDKYQGPYADIKINGDHYKVWTLENQMLWIEGFPIDNTGGPNSKKGFQGYPHQVADAINRHYGNKITDYNMLDFMNESIILEFEEDPYEGPQPGDMEYHNQPPAHQKGIGEFKNIDWKVLHEILVANDEYNKTGKVEKWPNFVGTNIGDLLDDGFLSKEEIDLLENRGVIETRGGGYPTVADNNYNDYNTFLHAAKKAWELGFDNTGLNQDHNIEAPFMRGRELDENHTMDFDTTNLYKFLKDAMFYIENNALDYAEGAHLLESALLNKFTITKKDKVNFSLNENPDSNPNVNPNSKIDRPTDSQGNPITNGARVEDLDTGTIGHVKHPGIDDNGNLTIHVNWMYTFGDAIVNPVTYPKKLIVKDDTRVVREDEVEEGIGHSYTIGRGQNIKPGNYPQTLKRVGLKEDFDYAAAEREHHGQQELKDLEKQAEVYVPYELKPFLVQNSFNVSDVNPEDGSFNYEYILKIPKQSDEQLSDVEAFVKEISPDSYGGPGAPYRKTNLHTVLEKATNKWIVQVLVNGGYDV